MIVGIDVDDVCVDLLGRWLSLYNAEYDDDLTKEDILDWRIQDYVACGDQIFGYLHRPDLYDGAQPVPGAIEGIRRLCDEGNTIVFITALGYPYEGKLAWLERHGLLSFGELVITTNKAMTKADVLVDDKLENVLGFGGFGILFASNRAHRGLYSYVANDWNGVIRWVTLYRQFREQPPKKSEVRQEDVLNLHRVLSENIPVDGKVDVWRCLNALNAHASQSGINADCGISEAVPIIAYAVNYAWEHVNKRTADFESFRAALCQSARDLLSKKAHDYATAHDPFMNFRKHGALGIVVRMTDKLQRMENFILKGTLEVPDESILDTCIDLINYSVIYCAFQLDAKMRWMKMIAE